MNDEVNPKLITKPVYRMLVEARDVEDLEEDLPVRKAPKSQLRVRPGLDEEYSSDEFKDPKSLKEGDEVEVFLEHLEDQEGAVVLSKKKADFMRVWERIREAHEKDEAVSG